MLRVGWHVKVVALFCSAGSSASPASSVFLSLKIIISHQPALFFSYNKSAPSTSPSQTNRAINVYIGEYETVNWDIRTATSSTKTMMENLGQSQWECHRYIMDIKFADMTQERECWVL